MNISKVIVFGLWECVCVWSVCVFMLNLLNIKLLSFRCLESDYFQDFERSFHKANGLFECSIEGQVNQGRESPRSTRQSPGLSCGSLMALINVNC